MIRVTIRDIISVTQFQRRSECDSQICEPSPSYAAQRQGPAMRPASKPGGKGSGGQNATKKGRDQSGQRLAPRGGHERGGEDMWHTDEYTQ